MSRIKCMASRRYQASNLFFFYAHGDHRDLHSFPTRRSSDLVVKEGIEHAYEHAKTETECQDRFGDHQTYPRSEEHTSELQSRLHLVCRLLLEKKKNKINSFA